MIQRIEWSDSYLLGISEIDGQHKKLLASANDLYDVASGTEDMYKINMSKVMKNLTDYTVYHFTSEENFMRKYGYSGADTHKIAHDNFISEVNNQIRRLSAGNIAEGLKFYEYIVKWVITHIAKADKIWAEFVKQKLNA